MNLTSPTITTALTKNLTSAFAKADFPCVIASLPIKPEAGLFEWRVASLAGSSEGRFYAGYRVRRDETDQPSSTNAEESLRIALTNFVALSASAGPQFSISSFGKVEAIPDGLEVLLFEAKATGSSDTFVVGFDQQAVSWFARSLATTARPTRPVSLMDTLLDVELPVSILLASREAPLSDVLQWGPGTIVEFEAGLGDPVDVIVNKQTVARGAVVLVDGNYGVRVTEVLPGTASLGG